MSKKTEKFEKATADVFQPSYFFLSKNKFIFYFSLNPFLSQAFFNLSDFVFHKTPHFSQTDFIKRFRNSFPPAVRFSFFSKT